MKQLLWTIQHEAAYSDFEKTGVLVANEKFLFCQDDLAFAYDWMSKQMNARIGNPPKGVKYPIWAWYQWEGKRKRMDQRLSGYAKRGTPLVQITFEADADSFLLSDFDEWHNVLANQYVAIDEADWDWFYGQTPHPQQCDVTQSWERIFDITHFVPKWDCAPEEKSIQATLWKIHISQIKKVEHFIAK